MDAHKGEVIQILREHSSLESPIAASEQDVSLDVNALSRAILEKYTDAGLEEAQIEIIRTAASTPNSTGMKTDIEALVELAIDALAGDLIIVRDEIKKSLKEFERLDTRTRGLEGKLADLESRIPDRTHRDESSSAVADLSSSVSKMEWRSRI
jgi:hypothetical protein